MVHVKLFISYAHKDDKSFAFFKPAIKEALNKSDFFIFEYKNASWYQLVCRNLPKHQK